MQMFDFAHQLLSDAFLTRTGKDVDKHSNKIHQLITYIYVCNHDDNSLINATKSARKFFCFLPCNLENIIPTLMPALQFHISIIPSRVTRDPITSRSGLKRPSSVGAQRRRIDALTRRAHAPSAALPTRSAPPSQRLTSAYAAPAQRNACSAADSRLPLVEMRKYTVIHSPRRILISNNFRGNYCSTPHAPRPTPRGVNKKVHA